MIKRETSRKGDNGKMKLGFITAICDGMTFEETECREDTIAEAFRLVYQSEDGRIRIYET